MEQFMATRTRSTGRIKEILFEFAGKSREVSNEQELSDIADDYVNHIEGEIDTISAARIKYYQRLVSETNELARSRMRINHVLMALLVPGFVATIAILIAIGNK